MGEGARGGVGSAGARLWGWWWESFDRQRKAPVWILEENVVPSIAKISRIQPNSVVFKVLNKAESLKTVVFS